MVQFIHVIKKKTMLNKKGQLELTKEEREVLSKLLAKEHTSIDNLDVKGLIGTIKTERIRLLYRLKIKRNYNRLFSYTDTSLDDSLEFQNRTLKKIQLYLDFITEDLNTKLKSDAETYGFIDY